MASGMAPRSSSASSVHVGVAGETKAENPRPEAEDTEGLGGVMIRRSTITGGWKLLVLGRGSTLQVKSDWGLDSGKSGVWGLGVGWGLWEGLGPGAPPSQGTWNYDWGLVGSGSRLE